MFRSIVKDFPGSVALAAVVPLWSTVPAEEAFALANAETLGPVALHLVVVDDEVDETAWVVNVDRGGDGWGAIWAWAEVASWGWKGGINGLYWRVAGLDWSWSGDNTSGGGVGGEDNGETHFEGVWVVGNECDCVLKSVVKRRLRS